VTGDKKSMDEETTIKEADGKRQGNLKGWSGLPRERIVTTILQKAIKKNHLQCGTIKK